MTKSICLQGGTVLTPGGELAEGDICIAGGQIVDNTSTDCITIDCNDLMALPGIIDVHGDAFEQEFHPRPNVNMPFAIAMGAVDRQSSPPPIMV